MGRLQTICEMPSFVTMARQLMTQAELETLKVRLARDPQVGDLVPGTGGLRKVRVGLSLQSKGRRGGARVIYYYHDHRVPLALVAIYAKGERIDLSQAEKKELRRLAKAYVEAFTNRSDQGR